MRFLCREPPTPIITSEVSCVFELYAILDVIYHTQETMFHRDIQTEGRE